MQTWRLIVHEAGPADLNMAVDEALAQACRKGNSPPVLRFYHWKPAALSVGYFQDVAKEINLERLRDRSLGLVRRISGGRAVLHDQELTYSLAAGTDNPLFPRDLRGTFAVIAEGLLAGLRELGVEAHLMAPGEKRRNYTASASCFNTALGFEIGASGKKLVGSAQRRWREGFLQHGSILWRHRPESSVDLLNLTAARKRELLQDLGRNVTSLSDLLGCPPDFPSLRQAFISGIQEALRVQLLPSTLTPWELELARRLAREKYGSERWNLVRPRLRSGFPGSLSPRN